MKSLTSIIIPTRNRARFLKLSLASALAQREDCEIVVVDNASTDETPTILSGIRDKRLRIYRQPHRVSMQQNMWSGLSLARGRYALILSDDDLLAPRFLATAQQALAERANPSFFTADYGFIGESGLALPRRRAHQLAPGLHVDPELFVNANVAGLCATVFPLEPIRRLGLIDNIFCDWCWWNVLCLSGFSLIVWPEPLAYYRLHPGSVSTAAGEAGIALATRDLYQYLIEHFGLSPKLERRRQAAELRYRYWQSRQHRGALTPFFAYGTHHPSWESAKLMALRCLPLGAADWMRQAVGRGPQSLQSNKGEDRRGATALS